MCADVNKWRVFPARCILYGSLYLFANFNISEAVRVSIPSTEDKDIGVSILFYNPNQKRRNVNRIGGGPKGVSNINSAYFIHVMPKIGGAKAPPPRSYVYANPMLHCACV